MIKNRNLMTGLIAKSELYFTIFFYLLLEVIKNKTFFNVTTHTNLVNLEQFLQNSIESY